MSTEKELDIVMTEMCNRVNLDWSCIDPKEEDWYLKASWTLKEQDSFKKWFVSHLKNNNEARKELLNSNTKSISMLNKAVEEFLFNYGWVLK